MTGVEASEEMTMEQIEAMSGGELLRNEVCIQGFYILKNEEINETEDETSRKLNKIL